MVFTERIKQLREQLNLPQRKVAEVLNIDSATYCKIERGSRYAKREQIVILADLLKADKEELLTLWLADQIKNLVVNDNKKIATDAIKIAYNQYNR
ncbi:MAG: helix-turn-helix domain-containing protein [Bacteroidales bacterium]|nr:helix-turn-helix domain-containing protein [Bacteroidales bacterium]